MDIYPATTLTFNEPIPPEKSSQKTITGIANAWKNGTIVDTKGWLWVNKDKLHTILRTNKSNARYLLKGVKDEYITTRNNKTYIRGFKVLEILGKQLEENGVKSKVDYLQNSKEYYDSINSCDKVKLLRIEYDTSMREQTKKLKSKRKKMYGLKHDELTGEELGNDTEFSHIRSVSIYRHLSDSIENGLVVNKSTHSTITKAGINDEKELKSLCIEKDWKLDWYESYVKKMGIK